jgi:predicted TIM-barrel fold metal-dependent hydrolase
MIVDIHTHVWQSPDQLGRVDLGELHRPRTVRTIRSTLTKPPVRTVPPADADHHLASTTGIDKTVVLGFRSRYLKAEIPNTFIAEYVAKHPGKLLGFAGIDPCESDAAQELRHAHAELRLSGLTLSPANQDFHPADSRALRVYEAAEELGMPILIHPGGQFTSESKLEYARPYLWDEIARDFPRLRLIIAQLGHPFLDETLCLLAKHPHVFADVSGLLARPWQAYQALVACHQNSVIDKLLFGSDFPYTSATSCIQQLYQINTVAFGTNLPVVPRESLRHIIERDTLALLGLEQRV